MSDVFADVPRDPLAEATDRFNQVLNARVQSGDTPNRATVIGRQELALVMSLGRTVFEGVTTEFGRDKHLDFIATSTSAVASSANLLGAANLIVHNYPEVASRL